MQPVSGTWRLTGFMHIARAGHAAVLLPDGKVLVAGGTVRARGHFTTTATAELFDPATECWTVIDPLSQDREAPAAILLHSGKALVAGGGDGDEGGFGLCELYAATAGTWSATGEMLTARSRHAATLLPDGRVLCTGGYAGLVTATAEVYDPALGIWIATEPMAMARFSHSATLLLDGTVLIAGGSAVGREPAATEIYDPTSGMWKLTERLNVLRSRHVAVRLDSGQILAAGGLGWLPPDLTPPETDDSDLRYQERLRRKLSVPLKFAELYNPDAGRWTMAANMHGPHAATATLLTDGRVLVTGGGAELYDPPSDQWTLAGSMHQPRGSNSATLLADGRVLVAGGTSGRDWLNSAEIFTPDG